MKNLVITLGVLLSFFSSTTVIAKDGFPGRKEFPEVSIYTKAQLAKDFNNVVIVDARSHLEYETLRIKGALNIPVASKKFPEMVKKLRKETNKRIVFYCNGRTCYKSYKATKAALQAGVRNVFAYDAGVFEWAQAHPTHAVLLGQSPMDPKKIIPKTALKQRFLDPKTFTETARSKPRSKTMIMDVRDMYQRAGVGFFPGMEKWVSLDDEKKLARYLQKAKAQNKTLYIYDEAGKQVRWLQYTLERENIKDYYFMHKGAKGFYKTIIN
ncbi:MAG: rhodanese-like domain-containing protein [Calditrichaceae bacterium]|jgi:rhodanese-related sulfurtransferase